MQKPCWVDINTSTANAMQTQRISPLNMDSLDFNLKRISKIMNAQNDLDYDPYQESSETNRET